MGVDKLSSSSEQDVTIGDSVVVEKFYNNYLPVFVHLGKHNYYNIMLDQTEEYYGRILYDILQLLRENHFQNLYNGSDRRGVNM